MTRRKSTSKIIVHCSRTRPADDIGVAEIRCWHKARGFGDIGYHFVIRRDGRIEVGRPICDVGAHCRAAGMNRVSVGVCLVGGMAPRMDRKIDEDNFMSGQMASLVLLAQTLKKIYPGATLAPHSQYDKARTCPVFDIDKFLIGSSVQISIPPR